MMHAPTATAEHRYQPLSPDALGVIQNVGCGGEHVTHPHTLAHCRTEFTSPAVFNRTDYDQWAQKGTKTATQLAHQKALAIIDELVRPPMDPGVEDELTAHVKKHRKR